ncbi:MULTISPECIES: hypothetical protein [unclassified Caballeronia]|uniref:hypothetical protein n=1 Tax=unclassified Caballeronia TaxID=2646786 RepID=UPI002854E64E|nr:MULTISPECIES: hypothetical protein [unclassified Caballeronia]MDR5738324.1 hypothetical protein [Caballeronia sp. LZ016]MDR5811820.1 hypothetical protein [Caballeronia sp. LZ019]
MKKHFAGILLIVCASTAAVAYARDDGPRFAQDRLDALVAQHAQANRHIAPGKHDSPPASAPAKRAVSGTASTS